MMVKSVSQLKAKDRPRRPHHKSNQNKPPQQKAEDFEKKLSNFLKDSEDKLTSIKRQTESRRGGKGSDVNYICVNKYS